jgi:hypothetical protein
LAPILQEKKMMIRGSRHVLKSFLGRASQTQTVVQTSQFSTFKDSDVVVCGFARTAAEHQHEFLPRW